MATGKEIKNPGDATKGQIPGGLLGRIFDVTTRQSDERVAVAADKKKKKKRETPTRKGNKAK